MTARGAIWRTGATRFSVHESHATGARLVAGPFHSKREALKALKAWRATIERGNDS